MDIKVTNVEKTYNSHSGKVPVLHGVNATFSQGKSYAIVGPSGSGKSTLLHIVGGLDRPSSGLVCYDELDVHSLRRAKKESFLNSTIGFVFQFHYLIRELSVLENIMFMGIIRGDSRSSCQKRALELLDAIGLMSKKERYPTELSGGEQQRVSLARAVFNRPAFLLADEPTGNLDAANAKRVVDLLALCQDEWGMGVVICSHDRLVYESMQQVLSMKDGLLITEK